MKRLLPVILFLGMAYAMQAQSLVSTEAQNATAVLEEFTGIYCGYCPEGHAISDAMEEVYGDRFLAINFHAGSFAVPGPDDPDFRTEDGEAFAISMGAEQEGYPSGAVNRITPAGASYPATGRGAWAGQVDEVFGLTTPINVGASSSYDEATRTFTITTETFNTAAVSSQANIVVAAMESGIIGHQTDYANGDDSLYVHNNVFRAFITGWDGDAITQVDAGVKETKTFSYTLPDTHVAENTDFAIYVTYDGEIRSGVTIAGIDGTTLITGRLETEDVSFAGIEPNTAANNDLTFTNQLGSTETYTISWEDNAPESWYTIVRVNGEEVENGSTISLDADASANINLATSSDETPGLADYLLTISSNSNPNAPVLEHDMHVISGIRDLVVSNPTVEERAEPYVTGLEAAGSTAKESTTLNTFTNFAEAGALDGVYNVYYNVSWTFPGLTETAVNALKSFMDNGGNLLIAGQDIGWDNFSGHEASNGTPVTMDFYTNYMHAEYLDDGSAANSNITAMPDDPVYGNWASTPVLDVDGGNLYPEVIAPVNGATALAFYTGNIANTCGVYAETENYKVVYLGIGIEQIGDEAARNQFMAITHNWFYDGVEVPDSTEITGIKEITFSTSLGQNFPNPATDITTITVSDLDQDAALQVFDIDGKLVAEQAVAAGDKNINLNVNDFAAGIYQYRLINSTGVISATKKLLVD